MPVFQNWARTVRSEPNHLLTPESEDELREALLETADRGGHVRVVGGAHSFTPVAASEDVWISLDALSGVVEVDERARTARVRAGTRLRALGPALSPRGLALANMGDIDVQSIAGAISTGTHGTGRTLGSVSTQVRALTLMTASGESLRCSADHNRELFEAARVSLGLLGVITEVELALVPAYRLEERRRNWPLEDCLARIDTLTEEHRHFELFWFPYSDRCATKALDPTSESPSPRPVRDFVVGTVVENAGLLLGSEACRRMPRQCAPITRVMQRAMGEGRRVDESYKIFASPRNVRFAEMEYAVPAAQGPACLRELRDWVRVERVAVGFPVEYRYVAADPIWLSPFYERDSAVIAVHMYTPMPREDYFAGCEEIFLRHGGRPHWGKMHGLGPDQLRARYPRFDDFLKLRAELDPRGVFLTPYLRKLFGVQA